MTHTALARKYRPTRFGDLAGQDHVAAGLRGAVGRQRVAHAYLLTGPRGVGKTTAARILAMALNCERRGAADVPEGEPCGTCDSCRRIWSGAANLDVVEIDAASNRGVDDARELRERAMYAASGPERYKVYIIDEAHMLTREAWNALLKILEEPPPKVVFVFATTEPQKIANTAAPVLSRVQRFDFRRLGAATIVERLRDVVTREGVAADPDALTLIARVAEGGMRDALSVLDQALAFGDGPVTAARVRDALGLLDDELYAELLEAVAVRRTEWVFPYVARLVDAGADLAEFVNGVAETLRALLMSRMGAEPQGMTETLRAAVARESARFTPGDVLRMLHLLQEAETAIRRSANPRLAVEALLLRFTLLDRTVELGEVLEALGGQGRSRAVEGGPGGQGGQVGVMRDRSPARTAPSVASRAPAGTAMPAAPAASLTVDGLLSVWDAIREHVARRRPMVAAELEHARAVAVEGGEVTLEVSDVRRPILEKNRAEIESAVAAVAGSVVRVTFRPEAQGAGQSAPSGGGGRRLDQQADRDQRLAAYRSKDQALDAVAESLDLELLD
jgi:DNA polymerase-3 subunit gamma/tau